MKAIQMRMSAALRRATERSSTILAVALVLGTAVGSAVWTETRLNAAVSSFSLPASGLIVENSRMLTVVERLDKQKDQRIAWAYSALLGVVAISVIKRVFPMPWTRWAYVLIILAGIFLLQSLRASDYYERRIAFLIIQPTVHDDQLGTAWEVLWYQIEFLQVAIAALTLFVGVFVVAIVSGRTIPSESDG